MGSAFHQLCPRYSGTLTPTAPTAIRLWDTFTFTLKVEVMLFNNMLNDWNETNILPYSFSCLSVPN